MANEDFNDDTKDAGDIGAGHSVTALYEIVPKGTRTPGTPRSDLKYQREPRSAPAARGDELLTVAVRFKQPDADESHRVSATMIRSPRPMTANLGFASAVAEFGMLLRGSPHAGRASYGSVIERARRYAGDDRDGYRAEFSCAITAASAVLPNIVPPSIAILIYASIADLSVAKLFIAAVVPGCLLAICLMVAVYVLARRRGDRVSGVRGRLPVPVSVVHRPLAVRCYDPQADRRGDREGRAERVGWGGGRRVLGGGVLTARDPTSVPGAGRCPRRCGRGARRWRGRWRPSGGRGCG